MRKHKGENAMTPKISNPAGRLALALASFALALGAAAPASAQKLTAATLVDRAEIEDLLTRYYNNFGKSGGQSFGKFYTDDAEMVLGETSYKGRAAIEGAYKGLANADIPQRKSFSFNILMTNPLIVVHGTTATARLLFTEVVVDKQGDAPRLLTQGKEFDTLVKTKGEWRIAKRQILGANQGPPAGWAE
jgi:hypothetical protein